jgi:SAM-dependent methyltransferase
MTQGPPSHLPLACPDCRGGVERDGAALRCSRCGRRFSFAGSVPIMMPAGRDVDEPTPSSRLARSAVRRFLRARLGVGEIHVYKSRRGRARAEQFVAGFDRSETVLNVGAGATSYGPNVVNLEISPSAGVDVVGLGEALPFADGSFQGVVLEAVLEHVPDAERTLAEIRRVLAPGGRLYVDVPFIQGYHSSPYDYRRYTLRGLRTTLNHHGYVVIECGVSVGPASATAWILGEFLAMCVSGRRGRGRQYAHAVSHVLVGPLRFLDEVLERHPDAYTIASGVYAIARSPFGGATATARSQERPARPYAG